jgi:hypothetical protein
MGPVRGLDVLEKRKFFCGRPFRNLITIPTDLTKTKQNNNNNNNNNNTDDGGGGSISSASIWRK